MRQIGATRRNLYATTLQKELSDEVSRTWHRSLVRFCGSGDLTTLYLVAVLATFLIPQLNFASVLKPNGTTQDRS